MKTILNSENNQELLTKIKNLKVDSKPLWGKMNATQMLGHLTNAYEMAMGILPVKDKSNFLTRTIAKFLIVNSNILMMPKNVKTAKELVTFSSDIEFEKELEKFYKLNQEIIKHQNFASHPIFGKMNKEEWGRLAYKHITHHLNQFGL